MNRHSRDFQLGIYLVLSLAGIGGSQIGGSRTDVYQYRSAASQSGPAVCDGVGKLWFSRFVRFGAENLGYESGTIRYAFDDHRRRVGVRLDVRRCILSVCGYWDGPRRACYRNRHGAGDRSGRAGRVYFRTTRLPNGNAHTEPARAGFFATVYDSGIADAGIVGGDDDGGSVSGM